MNRNKPVLTALGAVGFALTVDQILGPLVNFLPLLASASIPNRITSPGWSPLYLSPGFFQNKPSDLIRAALDWSAA